VRITVICSDASENVVTRSRLLSVILRRDFEVDIIGTCFGPRVWPPAADLEFHHLVRGSRWPMYRRQMRDLERSIRGDVVLAVKPLASSYGIALRHRQRTGVPVVLDVEDDELSFRPPLSWRHPLRKLSILSHPLGRNSTLRIIARAGEADAVTVSTTGLQRQFGGSIIAQAQDTDLVRPGLVDRFETRRALGIENGERIVVFMGTPRSFKGVEDGAAAVRRMRHRAQFYVIGADLASSYVQSILREFPEVRTLPPYPQRDMPRLLDIADAVVIPSRMAPQTLYQQPGKLLDAMAMAKPIVATAVSDIPQMLADRRGHVVEPGDVSAIAAALDAIFDDPTAAAEMGGRARQWCVEHASYSAMRPILRGVIERAAQRGLSRARPRV
jgi:glycosyltransferase involved in cell wall biosynthesis